MEGNTQKSKKQVITRKKIAPMCLGHEPCAQGMAFYAYVPSHAPEACTERVRTAFSTF